MNIGEVIAITNSPLGEGTGFMVRWDNGKSNNYLKLVNENFVVGDIVTLPGDSYTMKRAGLTETIKHLRLKAEL